MKGNKLRWLLAVAVLSIWGTIAYQVAGIASRDENDDIEIQNTLSSRPVLERFVYNTSARDPFQYIAPVKVVPRKEGPEKQAWTPPPLKLTGVIANKKKKTATLEARDGSVLFVQEGDTVQGVRILKIKDQLVTYRYQGKNGEWPFERLNQ